MGRLPNGSALRTCCEAQGTHPLLGLSFDLVVFLVPTGVVFHREVMARTLRRNGRVVYPFAVETIWTPEEERQAEEIRRAAWPEKYGPKP